MFDEIATLLQDRVDPVVWEGLLDLTRALEQHQAILYKEQLHHLIMDANNLDTTALVDRVIAIIYGQVTALLGQMKIELDLDQVTHQTLAAILNALTFAPNDQDEYALSALQQGDDPLEILAEVVSVYTGADPIEYLPVITSVAMTTLQSIESTLQRNLSYNEESQSGVQEAVLLLNRQQQLIGTALTVGMESLQAGVPIGTDTTTMVEQHREILVTMSADTLADALLSIALLGNIPHDALEDEVMHFVESIVDDPLGIQKTYKRLKVRLSALKDATHEQV